MVALNEAKRDAAYGVVEGLLGEGGSGREGEGRGLGEGGEVTRAVGGCSGNLHHQGHHQGRPRGKRVGEDARPGGGAGGSDSWLLGGQVLLYWTRLKAEDFKVFRPTAAGLDSIRPVLGGGHGEAAGALRPKAAPV